MNAHQLATRSHSGESRNPARQRQSIVLDTGLRRYDGSSVRPYHLPVFGIDAHGSCFGFGPPFCKNSIEMLSGERTKAM